MVAWGQTLLAEGDVLVHRPIEQLVLGEGAGGELIAIEAIDDLDVFVVIGVAGVLGGHFVEGEVDPLGVDLDLAKALGAGVDGIPVVLDDVHALLLIGLLGELLHPLLGFLIIHDGGGKLEEGGLQGRVGVAAHMAFGGQLVGVDDVELGVLLGQEVLHPVGHRLDEGLIVHVRVEEEGPAFFEVGDDVELEDVGVKRAGDEVGVLDVVFGMDRLLAEAEVAPGGAAGFAGVVLEVGLGVLVGGVADDLDRALVGRDGAIRAKAIEEAGGVGVRDDEILIDRDGKVGHVVFDADGEAVPILFGVEEVVNRLDVLGLGVLRGKPIAPAEDDLDLASARREGGDDVEVKRLAHRPGFLRPIEDGDLLDGRRDGFAKQFGRERAVEVDFDQADLLAPLIELIDDFHGGLGDRAHGDDDLGGFLVAIIDKRRVVAAGQTAGLGEILLRDLDDVLEVAVLGFAGLEVDVVVFGPAAGDGVGVRVKGPGAEFLDLVHREELLPFLLVDELDVLDFVRGSEPVEVMEDGDARLNGGQMGDRGEVGDFLDRGGANHRDAALADGIDVLVVAEDRKGAGGQGTGRDVEDGREQFANPLVDVRDHKQEALRSGEGRRERPGLQRAVDGAGGPGFRLHLDDFDRGAEEVLVALGRFGVD